MNYEPKTLMAITFTYSHIKNKTHQASKERNEIILKLSFIFLKTKNYKPRTLMAITYSVARIKYL